MVIKGCKPGNFESHDSLKLSFMKIRGLCSNFLKHESFLESNSPDILALCETGFDDAIDSDNFCYGLSSFNPKGFCYSHAWSCSLCKGRTSFSMGLICRKLCRFLRVFSTGFTSLSVLFLVPLLITFFVFMHDY